MLLIIFARLNGGLTMNIRELRNMFPALSRTVYGKQLVYFDNAATAQRSQSVIDKWTQLTIGANANIHRAVHKLAVDATDEYESTRDAVKEYINAAAREEIVFTSGTTGSITLWHSLSERHSSIRATRSSFPSPSTIPTLFRGRCFAREKALF